MNNGIAISDGCNRAQLTSGIIVEAVEQAMEEQAEIGGFDTSVSIVWINCHHDAHNVWIKELKKILCKYLNTVTEYDLKVIDCQYCVSIQFDVVLQAVDKEFSVPANYPKGHDVMFNM